jgi:hypothetical protein
LAWSKEVEVTQPFTLSDIWDAAAESLKRTDRTSGSLGAAAGATAVKIRTHFAFRGDVRDDAGDNIVGLPRLF